MPTHFELSQITAQWTLNKFKPWVVLYEYQSFASGEFPDVLVYRGSGTILFEIKVSRSDFLRDSEKEARKKWKPKIKGFWNTVTDALIVKTLPPELYYIEHPHLGVQRFYVCPKGLLNPEEIPEGWGLYWWDGKFRKKKDSGNWRADVHSERNLAAHALRRYASGDSTGILVNTYESATKEV